MKSLLTIAAILATASAANAFQVRNLDDVTHTITVMQNGTSTAEYTLAPGASERITGNGRVKLGAQGTDAFQRAFFLDNFVIWHDGSLHRQFRRKGGSR